MRLGTIVVADDVPETRELLAEFLAPTGARVLGAESGREASKLLRDNPCDLLITDVLMPDGDGIELITSLKKTNPSLRVLAISGGGGPMQADYCVKLAKVLGAHAGIVKPFNQAQLLAGIEAALTV